MKFRYYLRLAFLAASSALMVAGSAPVSAASTSQAQSLIERTKADMLTDPARAAKEALDAERLADNQPQSPGQAITRATALWLRAEALSRINESAAAAPVIAKAASLLRRTPHPAELAANILLTSGSIHANKAEVAKALEDYQSAHTLFRRAGDRRRQANTLTMIANLYVNANDFITALHYLDEALESYPADPAQAQSVFNSRGIMLMQLGRFDAADQALRVALDYARRLHSRELQATILENIANERLRAGKLGAADAAIVAARDMMRGNDTGIRQLDATAAQAALQHGRPRDAGLLIERAVAGLDLRKVDVSWHDALKTAVAVYTAQGRPDLALAHLVALKRLDDRATVLATQASTALMAARFDSANQEAKIARLRDAERLRQARDALQRAQTERTLWLGGAGATAVIIVLLLIGLVTIRRSRDRVRAAAADLEVTNGALGKALAAKTEFLATTSHEIRTPLNGILGMAQVMLADRTLPAPARERLGILHTAGLTMRGLVDDILDMAKVETGHLTLEQAPFDLPAVLAEAARMWADQAQEKGLALVTDFARCPAWVMGDAARVRQIACNLLSNALKFTAAGSVTLAAVATEGGVTVSVADTGIGIAPDKLGLIFESFRQADTTTTRRFGGTGLGLAICRSLARAMGGEIGVASRPGEGSTFTARLPLPTVAPPIAAEPSTESGDTLLIVDRNPITRAMLRALFGGRVAGVAVAGTIPEAISRLAHGGVTRVLVDEGVVQAQGDEAATLRALLQAADGAAVSLLSMPREPEEGARLAQPGVAQVIEKPIGGAALVTAVLGLDADQGGKGSRVLVSEAA